jgi:hypothetical protein
MIIIYNLYAFIYIFFIIYQGWSGKKERQRETAVNAACQENLLACYRFASPDLGRVKRVSCHHGMARPQAADGESLQI